MNEELEALDYLTDCASRYAKAPMQFSNYYKTISQALKRSEPMKPALDENSTYRCARCHHIVDNHYCSDCGGAVDWSDEK